MTDVTIRSKVWLEAGGTFALGEGALDLFDGVERLGSLAQAAREIGWSYRHAWGYVRRAEQALGFTLTTAVPGKGRQRGTALTREARQLLALLSNARRRARLAVQAAATRRSRRS